MCTSVPHVPPVHANPEIAEMPQPKLQEPEARGLGAKQIYQTARTELVIMSQ